MSLVIPKLYPIVDLDGIDLATVDGSRVPGIYNKIRDNLNEDKIEIFYHWFFADIVLSPYRVNIDDSVAGQYLINGYILVKSDDSISITGHTYVPVIESISINENGTYNVPSGVDGYNPVVVDVPGAVLTQLFAHANGVYNPEAGKDGFSKVTVQVPIPVIESITITENGIYEHNFGGFNPVTVNVPSTSEFLTPIHTDVHNGYFSSGRFTYEGETSTTRYDVFQVVANKPYLCILGGTVGNRFRAAFFTDDPSTFTENTNGSQIGSDTSSPSAYGTKPAYIPSADGYIAIAKTNNSVDGIVSRVIDLSSL